MAGAAEFQFDPNEEFPHLAKAPIVEAVIHWMAKPANPLVAEEFRKKLVERLKGSYPKIQPMTRMSLLAHVEGDELSTQQRHAWFGYRLETEDGRYIAQFNRDGLVFSRLEPYEDWDRFLAEGKRLWAAFCDLNAISEVERLAVRFINRIALRKLGDVTKILKHPPESLDRLGMPRLGFFFASKHEVPKLPFHIEVIETVQPPTPPQTTDFGLILDVDVYTVRGFACDDAVLDDSLTKMHGLKNKAFFGLLTKKAIRMLMEAKP